MTNMDEKSGPPQAELASNFWRDRFYELAPQNAFFLDPTDAESLAEFLKRKNWLEPGERFKSSEIAGQGNMNCILRIKTNRRTFILKQSRPWVEKYPHIAAPFDRALMEAEFYRLVAGTPAATFMPTLQRFDEDSRILCLDDLGTNGDCSDLYAGTPLLPREESQLYRFLSLLHSSSGVLPNRDMRALNHFHIFVFPFDSQNNFDLDLITPGLQTASNSIKGNTKLRTRITELGRIYLSDGNHLLHGDFFPGSWLRVESGIKVIDPEFGFIGPREFDLGVFSAHLQICGIPAPSPAMQSSYPRYKDLDLQLVRGFAGVEILRRLLGVAQLPIRFDLQRKQSLLELAVSEVLG